MNRALREEPDCSGRPKQMTRFCTELLVALIILSGRALAYEAICDVGGPAEKRSCLAETIPRTEAELQRIYQLATSSMDATAKELLEKSEAAWLAYRDSECRLEGDAARGGSLQPVLAAECEVRLTRQHIKDLTDHLDMMGH
jgi:uncharacterized protein YecT (DUF1311 family)